MKTKKMVWMVGVCLGIWSAAIGTLQADSTNTSAAAEVNVPDLMAQITATWAKTTFSSSYYNPEGPLCWGRHGHHKRTRYCYSCERAGFDPCARYSIRG
ncbi:hypothetical protein ACFL6U_29135 [Planctomycetota bacterium]